MAFPRIRALHLILAFLASMMAFVLVPTASEAHGSDAARAVIGAVASPTTFEAATGAETIVVSAALDDVERVSATAQDQGAAKDTCTGDGLCCGVTCHMLIDPTAFAPGTPDPIMSADMVRDTRSVLVAPIFGLYRPPRSV